MCHVGTRAWRGGRRWQLLLWFRLVTVGGLVLVAATPAFAAAAAVYGDADAAAVGGR